MSYSQKDSEERAKRGSACLPPPMNDLRGCVFVTPMTRQNQFNSRSHLDLGTFPSRWACHRFASRVDKHGEATGRGRRQPRGLRSRSSRGSIGSNTGSCHPWSPGHLQKRSAFWEPAGINRRQEVAETTSNRCPLRFRDEGDQLESHLARRCCIDSQSVQEACFRTYAHLGLCSKCLHRWRMPSKGQSHSCCKLSAARGTEWPLPSPPAAARSCGGRKTLHSTHRQWIIVVFWPRQTNTPRPPTLRTVWVLDEITIIARESRAVAAGSTYGRETTTSALE